ncbi:MAG: NADH-quinone oxidoreductase subunit N, partial [Candidatus Marinimicrobia bacterium]|nr:NADH-quinone oxidoreductase subunit N [Candidatus Neomarinimicrobiota bacterium]
MDNISSLHLFIPELTLTVTILVLVIYDLFLKKEESVYTVFVAGVGLVITMIALILSYSNVPTSLFSGMIAHDPYSFYFKFLFVITAFFTLLISSSSLEMKGRSHGEFNMFILTITLGMFLMASAANLLMGYLAIELVSVTSYIVAGYLKESRRSSEAALKYVIYGGVTSGIMLYGFSLLYGLTGTLDISEIGKILSQGNAGNLTVLIAFLMILAGFGYKIASVPFHFWSPDVYEGSPTAFTAFLSVGPKAAGFALLIRFFNTAFVSGGSVNMTEWMPIEQLNWPQIMMWISAITMTLGNLVALKQNNVKRLLAYSSIAHAGYVLMGIVVLTQDGLFAMMFYLAAY